MKSKKLPPPPLLKKSIKIYKRYFLFCKANNLQPISFSAFKKIKPAEDTEKELINFLKKYGVKKVSFLLK